MAHKRMFSKEIVGSDAFIEMPISSQLLYFQLGMEADDDGFVSSPKRVARMIGVNDDDIKVLIGKKFILVFPSGVVVIKHHRINNNWDKHNCKRTTYIEELSQLHIKENKAYTKDKTQGLPVQSVSSLFPVFRIEENRIEENREESQNKNFAPPPLNALKPNTEKGWRDLRRAEQGKPPTRTPRTAKQDQTFKALKWKDYFREQGHTQHGMLFFKVKNEKREKIVSKLIITAFDALGDKMQEFIDWWFAGQGEWAQYEPEQCFSVKTIERFHNKDKGKAKDDEEEIFQKLKAITKNTIIPGL